MISKTFFNLFLYLLNINDHKLQRNYSIFSCIIKKNIIIYLNLIFLYELYYKYLESFLYLYMVAFAK